MDTTYPRVPWRRILLTVAVVLALALAATAAGLFVWVRSYSPLELPAYGTWGNVQRIADTSDSSDEGALLDRRPGTFELDFVNRGRWPVTIDGIAAWPPAPRGTPRVVVTHVRAVANSVDPTSAGQPLPVKLTHNNEPRLYLDMHGDCNGAPPHTYAVSALMAVRYRYLGG